MKKETILNPIRSLFHNKDLQKRSTAVTEGGSTFASHSEHTPVFTTVHIIAAAIGIVGAIAVAVTIFIVCKKKRLKAQTSGRSIDLENNTHMSQVNSMHQHSHHSNHTQDSRFGQFASDFEPPKPAVTHIEDVSPMMQQYQLQLKLLQQQYQERKQQTQGVSTSSTSCALLPPPPYHP
ncbi:uncharacterized protein B0P05DRAFT_565801 [Gilbertella persicaria]|uniref:uncharacterized protein n=1 Tax=Gilbertella persicaria TaxID=101096 RepID=UPI00221F58A1|nr:uncharacterized protein B0P05DRAFT_565801 [Gilbertella persicaria]KAI8047520.1 hypothetical protein B0P05DRAFT_565801 [Gilbertella persicaria]